MSKSKIELIVVPVVLFFGILYAMVLVARANRFEALATNCALNNLRRMNTAMKDHLTAASDKMPDAADWADQIVGGHSSILKEDFITPFSHPDYGVFLNASFAGCDVSDMEARSVILFACGKAQWNASAAKETFLRLSSKGRAYIVTWNSDVYEYDSATKTVRRLSDDARFNVDDLMWESQGRKSGANP